MDAAVPKETAEEFAFDLVGVTVPIGVDVDDLAFEPVACLKPFGFALGVLESPMHAAAW